MSFEENQTIIIIFEKIVNPNIFDLLIMSIKKNRKKVVLEIRIYKIQTKKNILYLFNQWNVLKYSYITM